MIKRIAIVGYGNIARKHIEVLRALGCEIAATSNRSETGNKLAQSEEGIRETYTDYHEMIRKVKPDALIICVSFWNMYDVLKEVIPYGIPILAEKPTGTSLAEHLELVDLINEHQTKVMIGLNRRHYSVFNKAIEDAGGSHNITEVLLEWSEDPIRLLDSRGYTIDQTAKVMIGNTIHGIDTMLYLAGSLSEYSIHTTDRGDRFRWHMSLNGVSDRGVLVNFNSNWENFVPWRIVMTAPEKRYVFAPLETCQVFDGKSKEARMILPDEFDAKFKPGFYPQAKRFIEGNIAGFELSNAVESMKLAEMLYQRFSVQV